jgi:hypothetical protein
MSLPRRKVTAVPFAGRKDIRVRLLTALSAVAAGVISAGTCPGPQFLQHSLGSYYEHCRDNQPVSGYLFLLTDSTVNSSNLDPVCSTGLPNQTQQLIPCQPEAGLPGDGLVTLQFDWGGIGDPSGCPDPDNTNNGGLRMQTQVVSDDGTSVLASVAYSVDFAGYVVEFAHPYDGGVFSPLACDESGRRLIQIDGARVSGANLLQIDVSLFVPRISTDCDPGSAGITVFGPCNPGAAPVPAVTTGRVYLKSGPCGAPPADLRTSSWTFLADGDAQGHASVTIPAPPAGQCSRLGATYRLDGQEAPAVGGFVSIAGSGCEVDADGDGVSSCQDCDDHDPHAYPGNTEVCDGVDNDCDGATDEGLGSVTCGHGPCATVIPACSGGVVQTCPRGRPVTPPCGHPVSSEPAPIPVIPVD